MGNSRSFTASGDGLVNVLKTKCGVCKAFNPIDGGKYPEIVNFTGLWDTGATNTVITKEVAERLGLAPISKTKVYHANGESIVNVYAINLFLPNQVGFQFIRVTEGNLNGTDLLIGMDIINKGDFAITNFGGKTKFSFRVPSSTEIDFVEEDNKERLKNDTNHTKSFEQVMREKRLAEMKNKKNGK